MAYETQLLLEKDDNDESIAEELTPLNVLGMEGPLGIEGALGLEDPLPPPELDEELTLLEEELELELELLEELELELELLEEELDPGEGDPKNTVTSFRENAISTVERNIS